MLLRRREPAGLLVYLTRRSSHSRFMPGAFVFPGGAVDEADRSATALERLHGAVAGIAPEFAVAAFRELFEEAGVLIACDRAGAAANLDSGRLIAWRAELAQGADFAALLAREDLALDARELIYYSNWITPLVQPVRFDTHFFVARAPDGQTALADAIEVHDGAWFAPRDALEAAARNELSIMFPTRKHLERLAEYDSPDAFLEHARARTIAAVTPHIRDGNIEFAEAETW
jgi:8-oxo-dGTP pyrophosphatase MutT (NUDIX family)